MKQKPKSLFYAIEIWISCSLNKMNKNIMWLFFRCCPLTTTRLFHLFHPLPHHINFMLIITIKVINLINITPKVTKGTTIPTLPITHNLMITRYQEIHEAHKTLCITIYLHRAITTIRPIQEALQVKIIKGNILLYKFCELTMRQYYLHIPQSK